MPSDPVDLLYQLPVAGLLLVVVWRFLLFIKERDNNWIETIRLRDNSFLAALKEQQDRTQEQHSIMVDTLRQVAITEDRTSRILERLEKRLDDEEARFIHPRTH